MQFGSCLPRLLQKIWETDPKEVPVLISKWDILDAFHRCHICPEDVGAFTYVVPPIPLDPEPLLCIDLVLPMGWVNPPDLFCATSETVTNQSNITFCSDSTPQLPYYLPTAGLYKAFTAQPVGPSCLQYADVYMDDINCLTQGDQIQQRRLTERVLQSFKRKKYPAVKGELKDSIGLKKTTAGDGDWEVSKVILGWIINTSKGNISLSPKRLSDLSQLLDISPAQQ